MFSKAKEIIRDKGEKIYDKVKTKIDQIK